MVSVGETVQDHLDLFGEQLLQAIQDKFDKRDAAWEAKVRELKEENSRLRTELRVENGDAAIPHETSMRRCRISPDLEVSERPDMSSHGDASARLGLQHFTSSMSLASGVLKIAEKFRELDVAGAGVVKIKTLQENLMQIVLRDDAHLLDNLPSLLNAFRQGKPALFDGLQEDDISFRVFKELMIGRDLSWLDVEHVHTLNALRSISVHEDALGAVVGATAVRREELAGWGVTDRLWWLEPCIGCVIVVNAAIIGLSLDIAPTSAAWKVGELVCTFCFVVELILKLIVRGWLEYFVGSDWKWNLFDFVLVVLAVVEVGLQLYVESTGEKLPSSVNLRDVTVLRITRLLRIARLTRLFKLRYMKELTMMATGIIGGLRTLFWAFVLLFIFVYILGIVSQQTVDDWKARTPCDDNNFSCNEFERSLYTYYNTMFGDLFKTCLTVFRCVTGDCSLPEGTPLAPVLLETFGKPIVMWFLCCELFVMVCVFNLIMAVFVENTLDYAKQDQEKLEHLRRQEQVQQARKLQQLVNKLVRHTRRPMDASEHHGGLWKYIPNKGFLSAAEAGSLECAVEVELPTPFKVNRQDFDAAMADDEADDMLDYLEISLSNKKRLFDILDSDGDGLLNLHEIVDGIMRLRGPADKSDVVSNGLMIRAMQKSFTEMKRSIDQLKGEWQPSPKALSSSGTHTFPIHRNRQHRSPRQVQTNSSSSPNVAKFTQL